MTYIYTQCTPTYTNTLQNDSLTALIISKMLKVINVFKKKILQS